MSIIYESVGSFLYKYRQEQDPRQRAQLLKDKIIKLLRYYGVKKLDDTREVRGLHKFMREYEELMRALARRRMNISNTCYHFAELIVDDDVLKHRCAYLIFIYAPKWEIKDVMVWPLIVGEQIDEQALKVLVHCIVNHMPFLDCTP